MPKVPPTGEDHCHASLIRCRNHLSVADGTPRLTLTISSIAEPNQLRRSALSLAGREWKSSLSERLHELLSTEGRATAQALVVDESERELIDLYDIAGR